MTASELYREMEAFNAEAYWLVRASSELVRAVDKLFDAVTTFNRQTERLKALPPVAQRTEQRISKPKVAGLTPARRKR